MTQVKIFWEELARAKTHYSGPFWVSAKRCTVVHQDTLSTLSGLSHNPYVGVPIQLIVRKLSQESLVLICFAVLLNGCEGLGPSPSNLRSSNKVESQLKARSSHPKVCSAGTNQGYSSCTQLIPKSASANQSVTCNSTGTSLVFGECKLLSCAAGYVVSGNSCAPVTASTPLNLPVTPPQNGQESPVIQQPNIPAVTPPPLQIQPPAQIHPVLPTQPSGPCQPEQISLSASSASVDST